MGGAGAPGGGRVERIPGSWPPGGACRPGKKRDFFTMFRDRDTDLPRNFCTWQDASGGFFVGPVSSAKKTCGCKHTQFQRRMVHGDRLATSARAAFDPESAHRHGL